MSAEEISELEQDISTEPSVNGAPSWKAALVLRADLVQADVYAFEKRADELGGLMDGGFNMRSAHALKAAIGAGWLVEPAAEVLKDGRGQERFMFAGEDVDRMHPGKVLWFGSQITRAYSNAITVPPN